MDVKPRLVRRKGWWYVANPMGDNAKYLRTFVTNRWMMAYFWCNHMNFD